MYAVAYIPIDTDRLYRPCRVEFSHIAQRQNHPLLVVSNRDYYLLTARMCETFITKRIDTHTQSEKHSHVFLLYLPMRAR